jgi:hypothetical protein
MDVIYIQILTVIFSVGTLFFQLKMYRRGDYKRPWDLPITVWAILTIIFYAAFFFNTGGVIDVHATYPTFFSDWSTALRMYGAGTFFWSTFFRYRIYCEKSK